MFLVTVFKSTNWFDYGGKDEVEKPENIRRKDEIISQAHSDPIDGDGGHPMVSTNAS